MSVTTWTNGDISSSQTLTTGDHLYETHINELRVAMNDLEGLLDPDNQTLNLTQVSTTGSGLAILRDLAAASTNSPLTSIVQDNAGDDQKALYVRSDSTICAGVGFYRNVTVPVQGAGEEPRPILYIEEGDANSQGNSVVIWDKSTMGASLFISVEAAKSNASSTYSGLRVYSNSAHVGPDGGYLVNLAQDNANSQVGELHIIDATNPTIPRGALRVTTTYEQKGIYVYHQADSDGVSAVYLDIHGKSNAIYAARNESDADTALVYLNNDHANSTGDTLSARQDGIGRGVFIDQNANGLALSIDKDCTIDNTRTWAAKVDSDNAGTGTALGCGIDMSSFSVDEPILKVVADAVTGAGTLSGQIAIDVGGTTYYVPYYTHGS